MIKLIEAAWCVGYVGILVLINAVVWPLIIAGTKTKRFERQVTDD